MTQTEGKTKANSLDQWRLNLIKAVDAQASDETLWSPGSIGEAYVTQSLRWLHQVIEENDEEALQQIINQSKGDI